MVTIPGRKKAENKVSYWLNVLGTSLTGVLDGLKNYQWWNEADKLKQYCFYVDYDQQLLSPSSIDHKSYDEAYNHVILFQRKIRIAIVGISKANEDQLSEIITNFETAQVKELLGKTLERSFVR